MFETDFRYKPLFGDTKANTNRARQTELSRVIALVDIGIGNLAGATYGPCRREGVLGAREVSTEGTLLVTRIR